MLHCTCILNVVITTIIEMVEILDGRVGKHSVERVRYVIIISFVVCICTRLRLVEILMKYFIIFHAYPCNKSYNIYVIFELFHKQLNCTDNGQSYLYRKLANGMTQ